MAAMTNLIVKLDDLGIDMYTAYLSSLFGSHDLPSFGRLYEEYKFLLLEKETDVSVKELERALESLNRGEIDLSFLKRDEFRPKPEEYVFTYVLQSGLVFYHNDRLFNSPIMGVW